MERSAVIEDHQTKVEYISTYAIRPNPYQPRKSFDRALLEELAESIRQYGVMQPITVRHNGTSYELVAGERRLRACKMAGLDTIPSIVLDVNDKDSAFLALIENIQRQDLNFLEEAEGYQALISDYGVTQEMIASQLNKSQSTIANKLRILKLPAQIKNTIIEKGLTERHARALLKLPSEALQVKALNRVIEQGLNVKKTEEMIGFILDNILNGGKGTIRRRGQTVKRYVKDIRLFTNTVKQAVDIMQKAGVPAKYVTKEKTDKYEIVIEIPLE